MHSSLTFALGFGSYSRGFCVGENAENASSCHLWQLVEMESDSYSAKRDGFGLVFKLKVAPIKVLAMAHSSEIVA